MNQARPKPTIRMMIVDDDSVFRERLMRAITHRGIEVHGASNADEALALAKSIKPTRAVLDMRMPGKSGLELVTDLIRLDPDLQIVILTGYGSIPSAVEAVRLGAIEYLTKPADTDQILAVFDKDDDEYAKSMSQMTTPSLARVEWEHIQRVLADCSGNISQAARVLGIHRRSLQRKLNKFPPME